MTSYNQQGGYPQQPQQQPYGGQQPQRVAQYPQSQQHMRPQQPIQQAPQPQSDGSLISSGSKWLYSLLGVFVPFIGVIVLLCSDRNVPEGSVREKLKFLVLGCVIAFIVSIVFAIISAITGGATYSAAMY